MTWLFYALLAPLLFSVVNILDKVLRDKHLGTHAMTISGGLASLLVFFFLMPFVDFSITPLIFLCGILVGALFFLAGFPYFHALSIEEVSRVAPLWNFEAPITLVLAYLFLKEELVANEYIGFILVVLGAFLLVTRNMRKEFIPNKAFFLMIGATLLTAAGVVITKWLFSTASFLTVQTLIFLGSGMSASFILLFLKKQRKNYFKEIKNVRKSVLTKYFARASFLIAGITTFNFAVLLGSPSLTVALGGLAGLSVFVFATLSTLFKPHIIKEVIDRKTLLIKTVAITTVLIGVFLISKGGA
mgnify:CR=1 FL=1|tara:strand:+ start:407 stop:1309 length:903 start_codon:yes stop_codon:yes gene_type:complete